MPQNDHFSRSEAEKERHNRQIKERFQRYSQSERSSSRINNFMRLKPSFPIISNLFLALCLGVFALQVFSGVSLMSPSSEDLIRWGANLAPLTLNGDYWRLFSSMFLHIGLVHLFFNMAVLRAWCPMAESCFGRLNFILLYLFSGLAGGLTSALWNSSGHIRLVISAGASGALMGIGGAWLAVKLLQNLKRPAAGFEHIQVGNMLLIIGINLAFGFLVMGVDNAAHVGGLLMGFMLALLFLLLSRQSVALRAVQLVCVALLAALIFFGLPHSLSSDELRAIRSEMEAP